MTKPIPIPVTKLLAVQDLLREVAKEVRYPDEAGQVDDCLRTRLVKASGMLSYYTGSILYGLAVPIAASDDDTQMGERREQ